MENSIMPPSTLYSNVRFGGSHRHEVFFGRGRRKKSIELGLFVFLTPDMHDMSDYGVHFNRAFDLELKQIGQRAAMNYYGWDTAEFIRQFGKNYL